MKVACKCKSEFQDKEVGKGLRWANPVNKTKKDGKVLSARCTVCRTEHSRIIT